jgi:dynein heavy chain
MSCEKAFKSENPIQSLRSYYEQQISEITNLMELVNSDLSEIDRKKVVALVTIDVHSRDVVEGLMKGEAIADFRWHRHLRCVLSTDREDQRENALNFT